MIRIFGGGGTARYNVDGYVLSSRRNEPSSGYAQIFRNGCVEVVDGSLRRCSSKTSTAKS